MSGRANSEHREDQSDVNRRRTANASLQELGALLAERNQVDARIAALIQRPAQRGHIGEFIAKHVFRITECESASQKGIDGWFAEGPLRGKSVNMKFYGKDTGLWAIKEYPSVEYYLVLCGKRAGAGSSRGTTRPLDVATVYLVAEGVLSRASVKPGVTAGVPVAIRRAYRIYPSPGDSAVLVLTAMQQAELALFDCGKNDNE